VSLLMVHRAVKARTLMKRVYYQAALVKQESVDLAQKCGKLNDLKWRICGAENPRHRPPLEAKK
jgi:hypothetical protein